MRQKVTIRRALEDPSLLGAVLSGDSWRNWRIIMIAANGEELAADELEIFRRFTGRPEAPEKRVWCPIGRRGGKSPNDGCRGCLSRCAVRA